MWFVVNTKTAVNVSLKHPPWFSSYLYPVGFLFAVAVFEEDMAVLHSVVEYFLGDLHILLAILHDLFDLALAPPAYGL